MFFPISSMFKISKNIWNCKIRIHRNHNIENYLKPVDFSNAGNSRKILDCSVTKWFHRDKHDDNDDFKQLKTANESDNREMSSRAEAFVVFEERIRCFKVQK